MVLKQTVTWCKHKLACCFSIQTSLNLNDVNVSDSQAKEPEGAFFQEYSGYSYFSFGMSDMLFLKQYRFWKWNTLGGSQVTGVQRAKQTGPSTQTWLPVPRHSLDELRKIFAPKPSHNYVHFILLFSLLGEKWFRKPNSYQSSVNTIYPQNSNSEHQKNGPKNELTCLTSLN